MACPATRGGAGSGGETQPDPKLMSTATAAIRCSVGMIMSGLTDQHSTAGRAPSRRRDHTAKARGQQVEQSAFHAGILTCQAETGSEKGTEAKRGRWRAFTSSLPSS